MCSATADPLEDKRKEIIELKQKLNSINKKKEDWFSKKEEVRKQISTLIGDLKLSKEQRDQFTQTVRLTKQDRDKLNSDIKEKTQKLQELKAERSKVEQKHNIKQSPSKIKSEIRDMQSKLETTVMSFDKEKKMMDEIKRKKKQLQESVAVSDIWDKIKNLTIELRKLQKRSKNSHRKVQDFAKNSQVKHEELISVSQQVDELRKKEEEAFKNFVKLKKEFTEQNDLLKKKIEESTKISQKIGKDIKEIKAMADEKKKKAISTMKKEVEEKIKKKGKLTTEDLLIMQQK